jgi:DNA mismatch repair ATPase MutS
MSKEKKLILDYQTITELEIMSGDSSGFTIFEWLDRTVTPGGSAYLKSILKKPFCENEQILKRQAGIKYILNNLESWDINGFKTIMDQVERYYYSKSDPVFSKNRLAMYLEGIIQAIRSRAFRNTVQEGTRLTIHFITRLSQFVNKISSDNIPELLKELCEEVTRILHLEPFNTILRKGNKENWSFIHLVSFDKSFREESKAEVVKLVSLFYELDVLISMATAAKENDLEFPEIVESVNPVVEAKGLYHPLLKEAIPNSISFGETKNFLFMTGPNMSGKTTFLKSLGIAVYMAQLGMAVPAASMKMTPFQSIFSSLNTADNLSMGYSYFFSEVIRIKKAAENLRDNPRSFMIFDELFKGTNVKDAFDGSLLVIERLLKWKSSIFILSSHLLELEQSIQKNPGVFFHYFDSDVVEGKPSFTYKIHEGISNERLGLLILKNEKIDRLLEPDVNED